MPHGEFDTFRASADRLAAFARTHPIRALLGAHIEMTTTPGEDYAMQARTLETLDLGHGLRLHFLEARNLRI